MAGIETYVHNSTYLTLPEADKLIVSCEAKALKI